MINETLYRAERRDNTDLLACEEKSEVTTNTLDQNANTVEEELVFAMALNSVRNSFDGRTSAQTHCCTMSV